MFATGRRRRRLTPSTPRATPPSPLRSTPPPARQYRRTSRRTASAVWPTCIDALLGNIFLGGVILAACGTFLAGCATGRTHHANTHRPSVAHTQTSPHHIETHPATAVHPTTAPPGVNTSYPPSTYAEQEAVLSTWIAAEQQVYAYMDEPPAPLRADLIAGESGGELFPKLSQYYTGAALSSELNGLMNLKLSLLNGPTSFDLGTPRIAAITPSTAVVAFCGTDSGTTTISGKSGPLTLDGGPGGARGTSNFQEVSGSWLIYNFHTVGVTRC